MEEGGEGVKNVVREQQYSEEEAINALHRDTY